MDIDGRGGGARAWGVQRSWRTIDATELRRLYVDERLTARQLAARFRCASVTIFPRLRAAGIPIRPRGPSPTEQVREWTSELAWTVGLIATDGNLSDGHALAITSKDRDLLETVKQCLGLRNTIGMCRSGLGLPYSKLQWRDRRLYEWLVAIGLTRAKSLTLRPLKIPDAYFADFFRGCIDGDGSVTVYTDRYHTRKKDRYVYRRLYVSLVSGSCPFVTWLQDSLRRLIGVKGSVSVRTSIRYSPLWCLRYAKAESIRVLRWMYYSATVPSLARKRAIAEPFLTPRERPARHGAGRPMVV